VLLWFPIIEEILSRLFQPRSQLIIALNRTQCKDNNILMVSVIYQKRAFLFQEQQKVLRPVIWSLKHYQLIVIGDRELHGVELGNWLHRQGFKFLFEQKKNTTLFREKR